MRRGLALLAALALLVVPAHAGVLPGIGGAIGGAAFDCANAGSSYSTPGSFTFGANVQCAYTVTVIGGGAEGGDGSANGNDGAQSVFNTTLIGNGGSHGLAGNGSAGGAGGTASGGDTNLTGGAGSTGLGSTTGGDVNHSCTVFGTGGVGASGTAPGGGGGGTLGGGGGAGGCAIKAYSRGTLSGSISLTVGDRGIGGSSGGNGGAGQVLITGS